MAGLEREADTGAEQLDSAAEIGSFSLDIMKTAEPRLELLREHRMVSVEDFVVISGCSGGGKSTLLDTFEDLGHHIVNKPGRRIVAEELAIGGSALPWDDPDAFARRAIRLSLADRECSRQPSGWVYFDKGMIDAASALEDLTGKQFLKRIAQRHRYNKKVFLTPPWPEIYVKDNERRHDLADGVDEYGRLSEVYPSPGYKLHILSKVSVANRANFLSRQILPRPNCLNLTVGQMRNCKIARIGGVRNPTESLRCPPGRQFNR